jgi:hypothetical protein
MDTFTLVKSALAKSAGDDDKSGLDHRTVEIGRITDAVQTVVDALTPPDGGRYIVGFVDMATAATDLNARRIIVSSKPVFDRSLSLIEKAVVVATFAAHEIGHTIVTRPRADLIKAHNPKSGYHAVANLADDIILEPLMVDRFPILQDAFAFTGEWVLRNTAKSLPRIETGVWNTTPERFNTLISATRYGPTAPITWQNQRAIEEREWGIGWAERLCAARLNDHATFLALCDEAWERIRTKDDDNVEIEEPPVTDGPVGPGGDEPQGDDEDGEDGEDGDDQPTTDGPTQPGEPTDEDGEDEGEGGSDEADDEDEDGEQGDEPGDESEDGDDATDEGDDATDGEDGDEDGDGDEPGGDESDGTDEGGESTDWGDESDAEGEDGDDTDGDDPGDGSDDEDADGEPDEDGDGGGGNAHATAPDLRDEDDFDKDEVDQSTHSESHKQDWDYNADMVEQASRTYENTGTTAFGRHGKITTTWS